MAHLGKLFKLGSKKTPDSTRRDPEGSYRSTSDDLDDEGGYLDPTSIHATQPPTNSNSSRMPNYPPPRPHHYPDSKRFDDNSQRASVPANFGDQFKAPQPKARTQRPQSAGHLRTDGRLSPKSVSVKGAADDYCDPWDAKKGAPSSDRDDYSDPWDAQKNQAGRDNYSEPWDSKSVNKGSSRDDYSDPWDCTNRMGPKGQGKKDYCDPWDAKKPMADAPPSAVHTSQTSADSDDDDSYCEPYDTGRVAVLDEQAKNMSLKGMRLSSHEPLDEEKWRRDDKVGSARIPQSPHVDTRPADDYECPWESKAIPGPPPAQDRRAQGPSQDTRPTEDYECPWESKAIDTSFRPPSQERKEQNPTHDSRPLDDYDKPWEWNKKSPHWGGVPTAAPRAPMTGQAPLIDQRPPDDYDLPWEWNKKSSQFTAMMKDQSSNPVQSVPPKPPRSFQESDSTDPSRPLQQQCWYHGPLARIEAEKLLRDEEDCSFLVRNSESSKNDYSLSVRNNKAFMHLKIVCQDNKYILGQFSKPFDTVSAMIHHYSINKLNIKGAEHKILLHPVRPPPLYNVLEEPM